MSVDEAYVSVGVLGFCGDRNVGGDARHRREVEGFDGDVLEVEKGGFGEEIVEGDDLEGDEEEEEAAAEEETPAAAPSSAAGFFPVLVDRGFLHGGGSGGEGGGDIEVGWKNGRLLNWGFFIGKLMSSITLIMLVISELTG